MKTITKIVVQKKDKSRANLFLDNVFCCSLTMEAIVQNGLKVGIIITEERLKQIEEQSENQTALSVALKLVSTRFKTQKELETYLKSKGYSDSTILFVISKLLEYHYVDDEQYAKNFVASHRANCGKQKLKMQLLQKGVSCKIIDSVLQDQNFEQSQDIARLALKYTKSKLVDKKTYAKLVKYLLSKGFEIDEVKQVLNQEEFEICDQNLNCDGTQNQGDGTQNQDASLQIEKLAQKYMKGKDDTPKNYVKLIRYLLGKGFEYQQVKSVLKNGDDNGMWD